MTGFFLILRVVTKGLCHDHLSLSVSFGLKGHFFHLLCHFLFVALLLVLFAVGFLHNFSTISVHNNCILWIMLHLEVLFLVKIKSVKLVSHFRTVGLKICIDVFHKLRSTDRMLLLQKNF